MPNTSTVPFECLFEIPLRNGLTRPKAVRGSGIKMINMGELFAHRRISNITMDHVPISDQEEERYLLRTGDLLFARQSLVREGAGQCSIYLGTDERVTFESHIIRARLDQNLADPLYYFCYFNCPMGRARIDSIVEQVAAAGIRSRDLATLQVPHVPIQVQRNIARILGTLDDKIELGRRMNQTLEELARALFHSWFVAFDPVHAKAAGRQPVGMDAATAALFPDSFEESELGEIPAGWRLARLSEFASLTKGRSYKSIELEPSNVALVTLKSFNRGGSYRAEGLKPYVGDYRPQQQVHPGEVVIALTDVTQVAEVVGRPALVQAAPQYPTLVASLDVGILRPTIPDISPAYLYCLLLTDRYTDHIRGYTSGTTVLHLKTQGIGDFVLPLAPDSVMRAFTEKCGVLFERIAVGLREMITLESLRDTLLPQLLSGELRIAPISDLFFWNIGGPNASESRVVAEQGK